MILIQAKHRQKTVKTSEPPLNVLPVFIITEQTVYVKRRSLLSLHLVRTLGKETKCMWRSPNTTTTGSKK